MAKLNYKKIFALGIIAVIFAIIGWVLPTQEFAPTSYINASHIYSTGLTNTSGDNVSLVSEFDNITWKGEEQNGQPWVVDIIFENVTNFDNTESMLRYFSSSGTPSTHQVEFEIFCTMENAFTNLHTFTNQNDFNYFPKKFPDSHHFIFPNGTVILRLNHTVNGNVNHRIWIDSMRLVIQPQYEQVNASTVTTFSNTTFINTSCSGCVNQTQLNEKVNITTNGTTTITSINNTGVFSSITLEPNLLQLEAGNGGTSMINMNQNLINIAINGGNSMLFEELLTTSYNDINMSNKSILDCANCQVTGRGLGRAYLNTTVLNISDSVVTHIVLNNVSYNPYGEFNTTTGNYTVSSDGYYDIIAVANYGGVIANKKYSTIVFVDGVEIMASSSHSSNTLSISNALADTRFLHAGDSIGLYAFPQTGSNMTSISSGDFVTWMSVSLKSKI